MRVFVTGATGFIGSVVVKELINAGHQVLGLSRSDAGASWLEEAGAKAHRGSLEDVKSLSSGAAEADGVIHLAFDHDFSNFVANCEKDGRAIEAMGAALAGSDRPLIITSGTGLGSMKRGDVATEDIFNANNPHPRKASELAGVVAMKNGASVAVVRLPQVHDTVKQGLVSPYIQVAREKGVVAYVEEGLNRWPAAHVVDVARLYRLALEKHEMGARYHAVAEEGVPMRQIAETIGKGMKLPVVSISQDEAAAHFGWLGMFAGLDIPASGAQTQKKLDWHPTGPALITDLTNMRYL
jgi:nucleoside-diphosphate-sugar epimerase